MATNTLLSLWEEGSRNTNPDQICTCLNQDNGEISCQTYRNIYKLSGRMKDRIKQEKCEREVIGLLVTNCESIVAALIGILLANGAFHCIPKDIPPSWLEYLITTLGMRFIIGTNEDLKMLLSKVPTLKVKVEEIENSRVALASLSNIPSRKLEDDIAYVVTTSGTTGTPKIVWVPNKCIVPNILCFRDVFKITSKDTVFQASPLTFDPSVVEIFMTLSVGAKLVLIEESLKRQPLKMGRILMRMGVNVLQSTPTLVSSMGREFLKQNLLSRNSPLRVLALGGEKFPDMKVLRSWKDVNNETEIFNVYGITEVSSWATWCYISMEMLQKDDEIPLGEAIPNTTLKIVDDNEEDADQGLLYIGGIDRVCLIDKEVKLVPGTFRNTGDLVRRDASGKIWYQGRSDDQVKRLGKRLNLVQIEQVLQKFNPDITTVAVFEEVRKLLYVFINADWMGKEHSPMTLVKTIKSTLVENLPAQYQPDDVIMVDKIPITHHGKVDRASLLKMSLNKIQHSNNFPEMLTEYIMKQLNYVDVEDSNGNALNQTFFNLGGTSFKAVGLIQFIEDKTGTTVPVDIWEKLTDLPLQTVIKELSEGLICEDVSHKSLYQEMITSTSGVLKNKRQLTEETRERNKPVVKRMKEGFCIHCSKLQKSLGKFGYTWCSMQRGIVCTVSCDTVVTTADTSDSKHMVLNGISDNFNLKYCNSSRDLKIVVRWKYNLGKCNDASPLIVITKSGQDEVFLGSHSFRLVSVNLSSGSCLWDIRLPDRVESSACLTACGKHVVVGCYDGFVYSLERTSGAIYWEYQTGGEVKSSPCVDPLTGLLYIGSHDQCVHCLNIQEKKCVWKQHLGGGSVFSSPVVSLKPHLVITATLVGRLLALKPTSGDIVWEAHLGKPIFSSPLVSNGHVYIGCVDCSLNCFTINGQKAWTYKTDGPVFSSPCVFPSKPTVITLATDCDRSSETVTGQSPLLPECNWDEFTRNDTPSTTQVGQNSTFPKCISDKVTKSDKHLTQSKSLLYSTHDEAKDSDTQITEISLNTLLPQCTCDEAKGTSVLCFGCHDSYVHCVSSDGRLLWKFEADSPVYATPFITDFNCLINSSERPVGQKIETLKANREPSGTSSLADKIVPDKKDVLFSQRKSGINDQVVIVSSTRGHLYVLSLHTGDCVAHTTLPDEVFSSAVVVDGQIVVGCRDDFVYCLNVVMS